MTTWCQDTVTIHRVFRRELALVAPLVRTADGPERVARLGAHLHLLLDVLDHHHEGEDLLLWPRLRERAPEHVELFDGMDRDHETLHDLIATVRRALDEWRPGATDGSRLATAIEALLGPLVTHLDREERDVLPLVGALVTQDEWGELGGRAFSLLAPADAMIVLAQMGEDSPADEWSVFMTHLPLPVQEVYHRDALPAYPAYAAGIRTPA